MAVQPGERADAVRNRRAILAAAEDLLRRHEPGQVTVEQIAAAAGVSKATVFHRFASRVGLMRALMEERAQELREAVTSGPPPLGPGAPPGERLTAFLDAVIALASRNAGLLTAHEHALATRKDTASAREANPVYLFWHAHASALIAQARPGLDSDLLAHVLLGSLHTDAVARLVRDGQARRVQAGMRTLADSLLGNYGKLPRRQPRLFTYTMGEPHRRGAADGTVTGTGRALGRSRCRAPRPSPSRGLS